MKRTLSLAIVAALFIVGCPSTPTHPPAPSADCPTVCKHLRDELQCVDKTPDGAPCEEWLCKAHGAKLDCLAKATTCDQAKAYQKNGCQLPVAWVLGHDGHEVEERDGTLYCVTCDREVSAQGEEEPTISVDPDLHDQDVAADVRVRVKW